MSRITPLPFQERHIEALVQRFSAQRDNYAQLTDPVEIQRLRKASATVLLQAPTGVGKTLIATEVVSRFSAEAPVLWFWFAPFAGLVTQAANSLRRQATQIKILDIEHERSLDALSSGSVFVLTWQTVATRSREARLARQNSDAGLAIDELLLLAREQGFQLGVVVDEAHHGFVNATEAHRFFTEVMAADYALLMTATPRDADVEAFSARTGYQVGGPDDWATISRLEGYQAGLLKRGVKVARFITPNEDDAQLVDFEEVALSECAAMHARIKDTLRAQGIRLTPLMLVQVPNGGASIERAKRYLIETLNFPESAVRVHVANEPDPNLVELAQDPSVEVIIFKMAIAMGFDAPRAFTLAALRGARSREFGIQVMGRIMRVHRALQRLPNLPDVLSFGYVFLANSEAQEGLTNAANAINSLREHTGAIVPDTVVTFTANSAFVQVARQGQPLALFPENQVGPGVPPVPDAAAAPGSMHTAWPPAEQPVLFEGLTVGALVHGGARTSPLTEAFALDAQTQLTYPLHPEVPDTLMTEVLPPAPDDIEVQLVAFIDFAAVLADRSRSRTLLVKRTTDVFSDSEVEDEDIWARMSPAGVAQKARQIAFEFGDVDRRTFLAALKRRFREVLERGGHELPEDDEALTQQLELVLVRNPGLIRAAYKRCRASQITTRPVVLPAAVQSEIPLVAARRNAYRVMPLDLSPEEARFAELLDTEADVVWWHRNPTGKPHSVGLYRWSGGVGFFPDFVVAVRDRRPGGGISLVELKGIHLQQYDKRKAGAVHDAYGRAFMVGYSQQHPGIRLYRLTDNELVDDGPFEVARLRYD